MSSPSVEDLAARKRALREELTSLGAAQKKARRSAAGEAARVAREWVLTGRLRSTAPIIYVWSGFDPKPVAVFLRGKGRQYGWAKKARVGRQYAWVEKTRAELLELVDNEFLQIDFDELSALCDEASPSDAPAAKEAAACVAQWRTVAWSRSQTAARHVLPHTDKLMVQYESVRASFPECSRPRLWLGAPGARKRGTRLRERWSGRCGVGRPREVLPVPVLQEKAGRIGYVSGSIFGGGGGFPVASFACRSGSENDTIWNQKVGPIGSRKLVSFLKFAAPVWVLKSGPHFGAANRFPLQK